MLALSDSITAHDTVTPGLIDSIHNLEQRLAAALKEAETAKAEVNKLSNLPHEMTQLRAILKEVHQIEKDARKDGADEERRANAETTTQLREVATAAHKRWQTYTYGESITGRDTSQEWGALGTALDDALYDTTCPKKT